MLSLSQFVEDIACQKILPQYKRTRGERGTLPVYALWYVIVTKVIYRLAHKRKCVLRDVRIKTTLSLIWYGWCVNSGEPWGIGTFCRWKRLPKRSQVVYLDKNSQLEVCSTIPLDINGSLAGILDFDEDIVSKAGSDSGGVSSHDGSKNDTDSVDNTEPSIKSAICLSFNRKGL